MGIGRSRFSEELSSALGATAAELDGFRHYPCFLRSQACGKFFEEMLDKQK